MKMMTAFILTATLMLLVQLNSFNPVKMAIIILGSSSILFGHTYWSLNSPFFIILFYMLFMGGIILMMMILASLMPNEKSMKAKTNIPLTALIFFPFLFNVFSEISNSEATMKSSFYSNLNVMFMLTIILLYFISFVSILSSSIKSMRIYFCRYNLTL